MDESKREPSEEVVSVRIFVEDFNVDSRLIGDNELNIQTATSI